MRRVTINYKGVLLECRGYYTPAFTPSNRDLEPDSESFEIITIFYNDMDVTELFSELFNDWDGMETLCLDDLR